MNIFDQNLQEIGRDVPRYHGITIDGFVQHRDIAVQTFQLALGNHRTEQRLSGTSIFGADRAGAAAVAR